MVVTPGVVPGGGVTEIVIGKPFLVPVICFLLGLDVRNGDIFLPVVSPEQFRLLRTTTSPMLSIHFSLLKKYFTFDLKAIRR